jgi:hypothetical protein
MVVRSGRLLPSVIVGALVTGALVLGAGVAGADEECRGLLLGTPTPGTMQDGECKNVLGQLLSPILPPSSSSEGSTVDPAPTTANPGPVAAVGNAVGDLANGLAGGTSPATGSSGGGTNTSTTGADTGTPASAGSDTASDAPASTGRPAQAAVPAPSGVQAPDVRGGLLTPAVSAPGGLAARVPALGFGAVDPRLLMVPTGSPLRTLTGVTPGSPVTTSSDVQAMALDGLPSGLGTPAVLGVLILSTLAGFALRHRVLRRVRLAAAPKPEPAG